MIETTQFKETAAAYHQVKLTIDKLSAEHANVSAKIKAKQAELKAAPLAIVPFEDMKAGILEFVQKSGERYAHEQVSAAIANFATGAFLSTKDLREHGKPMRYCDLENCIAGRDGGGGWAQLLTPEKYQFNDQVLYFFLTELVKQGLSKVMDEMPMEAFGYGRIGKDQIGSDRVTRQAEIAALTAEIQALVETRNDLREKLRLLGVTDLGEKAI